MKPKFENLKAFVPSKDFELSKQFYAELFEPTWVDKDVCGFAVGHGGFLLQNFYQPDFANNCMYQIACSDAQEAWRFLSAVVARYPGASVRPPKEEPWGLVVYLFGPSGELWHVTQRRE
jgi:predicted enzyme related to lactoylglutathione lyase